MIAVPAPAHADASHRVTAPGGYEWWYFDAEDESRNLRIVAILLEGFIFHPGYLRAYQKYVARPTKRRPPTAADYPCAYLAVYRNGRLLAQFMSQYQPRDFEASDQQLDVRMGPNSARVHNGSIDLRLRGSPWHLTWRGPRRAQGGCLAAEMQFRPRFAYSPLQTRFFSPVMSAADHHWVLANPLCDVSGSITLNDERIAFSGRGYHDHNYGTAPIGPGLRRWIWGRALSDDRVLTFHLAEPRSPALPIEAHLVEADQRGIRSIPIETAWADWSKVGLVLLAYPKRVILDDVLVLDQPTVIDQSPFYLRVIYRTTVRGRSSGTTMCEVAYPHRLRWPILGRMIEMSIHETWRDGSKSF